MTHIRTALVIECPAVVIPLTMSAYTLLQRNLLYTAVTRAKRLVVLAGSRKALAAAVHTAGTGRRHTALTHRPDTPPQRHGTVRRSRAAWPRRRRALACRRVLR
jgi:superfamily I DNA and RNA helicase